MTLNLRADHFTVLTDDLAATEEFYTVLLGFKPGPRPALSMPGIWLYAGNAPILHVVGVETLAKARRGVLDHMAFRSAAPANGVVMKGLIKALDAREIAYRLIQTPEPWQQWQLFFNGPSGEKIEVDFDG